MFISVQLIDTYPKFKDDETTDQYICYVVKDTDFSIKLENEINKEVYDNRGEASMVPSALIAAYRRKGKNVAKNLAIFYLTSCDKMPISQINRLLTCDFDWADEVFPELNCKQYQKCIINQMKLFNYTGALKNAKRVA